MVTFIRNLLLNRTAVSQVRWLMEVGDGAGGWTAVGSSSRRLSGSGAVTLYPDIPYPTPEARELQVNFR